MGTKLYTVLFAVLGCLLLAQQAKAEDYAYGYSSIEYDSNAGVVRGYHSTEVDYNTDIYYYPYVCGEIEKEGSVLVRICRRGTVRASVNTQVSNVSPDTDYWVVSDHYVDMEYFDETNPGYYEYQDQLGYSFLPVQSYPYDRYYFAPGTYTTRNQQSIRLGDTQVGVRTDPKCGDERDTIKKEYVTYRSSYRPTCNDFTQFVVLPHYTFNQLNSGNYSWAILTDSLQLGLEQIHDFYYAPYGFYDSRVLPINSGYRNPRKNAGLPGSARDSNHIQGLAADISAPEDEVWEGMRTAGKHAGACVEPKDRAPTWVHVDWRPGAPQCPPNW